MTEITSVESLTRALSKNPYKIGGFLEGGVLPPDLWRKHIAQQEEENATETENASGTSEKIGLRDAPSGAMYKSENYWQQKINAERNGGRASGGRSPYESRDSLKTEEQLKFEEAAQQKLLAQQKVIEEDRRAKEMAQQSETLSREEQEQIRQIQKFYEIEQHQLTKEEKEKSSDEQAIEHSKPAIGKFTAMVTRGGISIGMQRGRSEMVHMRSAAPAA